MANSSVDFPKYAAATGLGGNFFNNPGVGQVTGQTLNESFLSQEKLPFNTSTNIPDFGGNLLDSPASGGNASAFTFITAPGQVSYSQGAEVNQVSIFGTNNPPLTVAGRNAGELQLGDALMEGFILGKQVQQSLDQLFQMQEVVLESKRGFVNVPVYTVFAGGEVGAGKPYGDYVIENIQVDGEMRDLKGMATRARVSVTFREVPKYQIDTGLDQATSTSGGSAIKPSQMTNQAVTQNNNVTAAANSTPSTAGNAAAAAARTGGGGSAVQSRNPLNPADLRF